MKILVTGSDGYIGLMLTQLLAKRGHKVTGLDTGFYRSGWLFNGVQQLPQTISKDIRQVTVEDLRGFDALVHLAELSNDPLGQINPQLTMTINHLGSVRLAKLAKKVGITRFAYTSSCSIYGIATNGLVTEKSAIHPLTAYATCKALVEKDVAKLTDRTFSPTFLRNATAFGASPRMRFDLVLNNLAGLAWTTKKIVMTSDGTPWRPLVHVLDICEAIACTLEAPRKIIHNQIFNVGDNKQNYQVKDIAQLIADVFPGCQVSFGKSDADNRSYRVSFDKINSLLPNFVCRRDAGDGAKQLWQLFNAIDLTEEIFQSKHYTRLKQLEYLIRTKQVDDNLFWKIQ